MRFCYYFFSPTHHDVKLVNRVRVRRQLGLGGLSPQSIDMPIIHKKSPSLRKVLGFFVSYEAYIAWIYTISYYLNVHRFSYLSMNDSHSYRGSALE